MFTLPDNPYEILNVTKNAQIPEIRSAHRKLVLKCHPDKVTDPAQKAIKVEEFQKVQKAYELLSNENERQKYDDMVRANELEKENAERRRQREREFTPGRTPPRTYDSDYGRSPHYTVHVKPEPAFKVRTAEPPPFTKSSTWAPSGSKSPYTSTRTPPRSYEDMNNYSSYDDLPPRDSRESRRSRKASVVYEEKIPSRHDEERRSRKKAEAQEEFDRQQEKARRKEEQKREAQREAAREAERKEFERKERERRKDEKKRAEKVRDTERKRESDDKRSRHKTPYVEEDSDPIIFNVAPAKSDKKSKSSSRSKEIPVQIREVRERELKSERDIKHSANLDFAAQYLETSRSKGAPGLPRRQTYHYTSAPPPAVATPPPAAAGVAPPPPMPSMVERMYEEDDEPVMRSSATRRRMSHDSPKVKEKSSSSSHKKSSSAREPEYVAEPIRPVAGLKKSSTMPPGHAHQGTPPSSDSPPKMHRAQTDYVRPVPGPLPGMSRTTWAPGDDMHERSRSRHKHYTDDESEEEPRPRRNRRTRSPDESANTFTYKVENGRTKAAPRSGSYRDESPVGRRSGKASYYIPEPNTGRPLEHRPAMHSHESYSSQHFPKVKTARAYDMGDVMYSDVPHAPSYGAREAGYGYA